MCSPGTGTNPGIDPVSFFQHRPVSYADAHSVQKARRGCLRRVRFAVGIEPDHACSVASATTNTPDRRIAVSGEYERKPAALHGNTNGLRDHPGELERTADLRRK
jgi:hypothetical protein